MSTPWPDGHPFALALSHDVDRVAKRWWQFLYYVGQAVTLCRLGQLQRQIQSLGALLWGDDPYWNFQCIIALEDDLDVRSTFFFLDEQGKLSLTNPKSMVLFWGRYTLDDPRIQKVIQELEAGGWEIGLHGSYHSYLDQAMLGREKERLEAILGHAVAGVRQHYLRLEIPETWHIHARLGFTYDSTLGYADSVGFRWETCLPFHPIDSLTGQKIPVLQIPLAIMDGPLMRRRNPWSEALRLIESVEAAGGVLALDWHQRVFNPWEPEDYQEMYVRIIRECQRRGAWVVPLGRVAEWWQSKNHRSLRATGFYRFLSRR
jgi:peptidoglycan/xylan/chitin deacetylase (PgdA/CDA1 family)